MNAGHEVVAAEDGLQALQALESGDFDLLLSDIVMPELDGIALALKVAQKDQGSFPESLDALASLFPSGVPTDPAIKGPFRYERTESGAWLKATRPDRTDEELREDDLLIELR